MRSTALVRIALAALALVLVASAVLPGGAAQERGGLSARLSALVAGAGLGEQVSVSVADAVTGRSIFAHHAGLALNPASNMKILTAATALLELGPGFTMQTGLYGAVENGAVDELVLRGYGDPTLTMGDFFELAAALRDRGVRRVGTVVVDGSYFDDQTLPPAFDQQPGEVAGFRAAIAAVSIERSAYELRVVPGAAAGAPGEVRLDCPGYFELESRLETSAGGEPNVIADQSARGDTMRLVVRGQVPLGILGASYRRRVESPDAYAGHCFVAALGHAGIRASGRVRIGQGTPGAALLTSRTSRPLAEILPAMGKWSDNFTAEMLLKVLGAERARPGTSARGVERVLEVLGRAGVQPREVQLVNGSGLFSGNRIAAGHVTRLLAHVYQTPAVRAEFVAHLAVAGRDGTLASRLDDLPVAGVVRAKTGTLNDAIALSGYVLGPRDRTVAFSVLTNGVAGKHGEAMRLADDVVRAIVTELY